jgi:PAP2 superfamily
VAARLSARREIALVLLTYGVYLLVRKLVLGRGGRVRAERNAGRVVALEERLGIHVEPAVQRAVLRYPRILHGLNAGYAVFNVTLTVGWALFLLRRRDPGYVRLRNACLLTHLGAQPVFLLFPTAPPRVSEGFVDTMAEVSGVDLEHRWLVRLYNPVAAMPSLHVAFAVVTAAELAERATSSTGKLAAASYPPLVSLVITATGNHYVLDAVAGAALGAGARRLTRP